MCNGASPLLLDNARHNSALHWAASCCRADCVGRLLGAGAMFQMQSGQLVAIAGGLVCFWEPLEPCVPVCQRLLVPIHAAWINSCSCQPPAARLNEARRAQAEGYQCSASTCIRVLQTASSVASPCPDGLCCCCRR